MNVKDLIRSNVRALVPYSSARDDYKEEDSSMTFMDANENPFETGLNRYPDPKQKAVKSVLSEQKGINPKNILLGNGSDEVLDLLFRAFCEPGIDNCITLPPTYGMYGVLAAINDIKEIQVKLTDQFEPDIPEIVKAMDNNSKLLFLCSPNNPTGNLFKRKSIESILNKFNGVVIIDEAYIDFCQSESWIESLDQYPNLVVIQTLSKAYGMAGLRLGVCYASETIINVLNKIKPPYNINQLTQKTVLKVLSNTEQLKGEVKMILEERASLAEKLVSISFVKKVYPSESNFILLKVDHAEKRYEQLLRQQVVIRNRHNQPLCENCLRITVGTPQENKFLLDKLRLISDEI
jgi:histidinol-phosphate aminotransferase